MLVLFVALWQGEGKTGKQEYVLDRNHRMHAVVYSKNPKQDLGSFLSSSSTAAREE